MKAFAITRITDLSTDRDPLELIDLPKKEPAAGEILVRVSCCGVCHTELDEIEGRTPPSGFPRVPGHQVVGRVEKKGTGASRFNIGDRVGVAWIYDACGKCEFCIAGYENLCSQFHGTGRDSDGGYAEYMTVNEDFAFALPDHLNDASIAPLLCAGSIGYRALQLTQIKNGQTLGLSGFGTSAHLVLKMVRYLFPDTKTYVFTRSQEEQALARQLGAHWAGGFDDKTVTGLQAIIDTTPAWQPSMDSLLHLKPGGRLVVNVIRKEDADKTSLMKVSYGDHLWMEKEIKSVANITRKDVEEFLALVTRARIKPEVEVYNFMDANKAILDLKNKHVNGAKVLMWKST